jgi:hypothetical protein
MTDLYCRFRSRAVIEQRVLPTMTPSGFSIGTICGFDLASFLFEKLANHKSENLQNTLENEWVVQEIGVDFKAFLFAYKKTLLTQSDQKVY